MEKLYNFCLFTLFNLNLDELSLKDQFIILKNLNLLPYKYRLLYRLSLFTYKVVSGKFLKNFKNELIDCYNSKTRTSNLYIVPFSATTLSMKRTSIFIPKFIITVF